MTLRIGAMIAANVAALFVAIEIVRRWGTGKGHLDFPLVLLAKMAVVSCAVIAAGTTGTLSPHWLGGAGLAAIGALWLSGGRPKPFVWPPFGRLWYAAACVVLLRLVLQVWFFSPHNFDAVSYHLTKIPEWIRAGGFTWEMGVDTHATFPAGFELVEAWWVVFLRHDVLIEAAGVEFLLLAATACAGLARELGLERRAAAWAGLLYALTPGMSASAISCLNDVPVAGLIVLTFLLILAKAPWPWLALVVGLGIGIKPIYGYALPGFALLAAWGRREPWAPTGLGARVVMTGLGALPGLFWYVRNALWFGNPVHPVGSHGLIGGTGELKIQMGPSLVNGVKNLAALVGYRVHDDHVAYSALLIQLSGWGTVAFAVGAPALWLWARETPRAGRVLLSFVASLVSVLFLVNHDEWCARFVLFFPALFALTGVWLAARFSALRAIVAVGLVLQFAATCFFVDLPLKIAAGLARQGWRERTVAPAVGFAPAAGGPVLYRIVEPIHDRGESYLLYGPDYTREVVYFRGRTAEDLERTLKESGARYLYAARVNPKSDPLLDILAQRGALRLVEGRLYEVR